ncbi:hypothetical protein CCACVL1_25836 [Corchorus capsularis]|uniref:HMA domain-containing protein n=1 Tax=Corchorus capsularis TaxID=210143 RepID=A0A1R3GH26_COCAP|nr:hypothetical protein CCACVL1_25836 [Corchorus capsularis]
MKRIVVKLGVCKEKQMKKVMKTVSVMPGIKSINIDMDQRLLTLITDVDVGDLLNEIRNESVLDRLRNKRPCSAKVVLVEPYKEEEEEKKKKKNAQKKDEGKKTDQTAAVAVEAANNSKKEEGNKRRDEHTYSNHHPMNMMPLPPPPYDYFYHPHDPRMIPPYPCKVVTEDQYPTPSCVIC